MRELPPCVAIMGPTGAGKSALALELANAFDGEILNADARQIYVGMDIGTDKPGRGAQTLGYGPWGMGTARDGDPTNRAPRPRARDEPTLIEGVPHHLLDIRTPDQRYSAAEFRDDARRLIASAHRHGKLPIVVGGTGFYIRVLTGDRPLPNVPPDQVFRAWADGQPLETLTVELRMLAPDLAARVDDLRNRRRVTRALEIARAHGNRKQAPLPPPPWNVLKLALLPPPDVLCQRIAERVNRMFRRGFVAEVQRLVTLYGEQAPGLQAVGYRQVFPYLRGDRRLAETKRAVLRAHWDYARRQRGWLKKEPGLVPVASPSEAREKVASFLAKKESPR